MTYFQLNTQEQKSVTFQLKYNTFLSFKKVDGEMSVNVALAKW